MSWRNTERLRRFLPFHRGVGIAFGLITYVLILTGCFAVFAQQFGAWGDRGTLYKGFDADGLGTVLGHLHDEVPSEFGDELLVKLGSRGQIEVFFRRVEGSGSNVTMRGVQYQLDPGSHRILSRTAGTAEEIDWQQPRGALADFYSNLHKRLHVPAPWGYYLTGVAGLALLMSVVTGLVLHRRIWKEIVRSPWRGSDLQRTRAAHTTVAAWSLPFAVLLSFTGTLFSFATAMGVPLIALAYFHGNQAVVFDRLFSGPSIAAQADARSDAIERAMKDAVHREGAQWSSIKVEHWGKLDEDIEVGFTTVPRTLLPQTLRYDRAGVFAGRKPDMGDAPSASGAWVQAMGALHVGGFAGFVSKTLWVAMALGLASALASGLRLWSARRSSLIAGGNMMARALAAALVALPFGLVAVLVVHPLALAASINPYSVLVPAFTLCTGFAAVTAVLAPERGPSRVQASTGLVLISAPVVSGMALHYSTLRAWEDRSLFVVATDLGLIAFGVFVLLTAILRRPRFSHGLPAGGRVELPNGRAI